jgi:hypothetical protein
MGVFNILRWNICGRCLVVIHNEVSLNGIVGVVESNPIELWKSGIVVDSLKIDLIPHAIVGIGTVGIFSWNPDFSTQMDVGGVFNHSKIDNSLRAVFSEIDF